MSGKNKLVVPLVIVLTVCIFVSFFYLSVTGEKQSVQELPVLTPSSANEATSSEETTINLPQTIETKTKTEAPPTPKESDQTGNSIQDSSVKLSVSTLLPQAIIYQSNESTYEGFCSQTPLFRYVQCLDTADSFMIYGELSDGTFYCRDSSDFEGVISEVTGQLCKTDTATNVTEDAVTANTNTLRSTSQTEILQYLLALRRPAEEYWTTNRAYDGFCETIAEPAIDCAASGNNYRASAKLDATYRCIDAMGRYAVLETNPLGTTCE